MKRSITTLLAAFVVSFSLVAPVLAGRVEGCDVTAVVEWALGEQL